MLVNMPSQCSALAKINERNRQFWLEQSALLNRRMQDEGLYRVAMDTLSREETKMCVKNRDSFEEALARAENLRAILQHAFSRKGGKAAKTDALQCLIINIVRAEPEMHTHQLLHKIRRMAKSGNSIFNEVARKSSHDQKLIHFDDNGKPRTAPVSGLKDRLYRAKRKIHSP